jgi:glycosyltransferase involved in cell wall biosynthesis
MTQVAAHSTALSVIILTHDEEQNLFDCLASLAGLNCEVFVVDSGSSDRTLEIAAAAGAQIVCHPFENYAAQRNWAQHTLPVKTDWLLHLDADERLTTALRDEIAALFSPANESHLAAVDGFMLRQRTIFMNRWIKHGAHYPSYHLRLFRKANGACEERLYDQHFVVNGNIATLEHDYLNVLCADLDTWVSRHLRWADLEARQMMQQEKAGRQVRADPFGNPIERKRWLRNGIYNRAPLFLRALLYWFYRYFLRLGFLDGKEGFIFHFLQGLWFRLLVDVKLYQLLKIPAVELSDKRSEVGDQKSEPERAIDGPNNHNIPQEQARVS